MSFKGGQEARFFIAGVPIALAAQATTTLDNRIYTISDVLKQVLDYNSPISVFIGGVKATEDFLIDYTRGKVIFAVANATRGAVTLTGKYVTTAQAATANKFDLKMKADVYDVTVFSDTIKKSKTGLVYAEGTVGMIETGDSFYKDALLSGNAILLEFKNTPNDPNPKRIWAYMDSLGMTAAVTEAQQVEVSFKSTGIV